MTARIAERDTIETETSVAHVDADLSTTDRKAPGKDALQTQIQGRPGKTMSIEAASALKEASKRTGDTHCDAQASKSGNTVWGPNGKEGISPEEARALRLQKTTFTWGPKPASIVRACRMREGNVTKRIRMDRERLTRKGLEWTANGLDASAPHPEAIPFRPGPDAYFKAVPLAVVQQNKHLVGLPLQRNYLGTRALSTDPFVGMGASHALGRWAQQEVYRQTGGGGLGLYWADKH